MGKHEKGQVRNKTAPPSLATQSPTGTLKPPQKQVTKTGSKCAHLQGLHQPRRQHYLLRKSEKNTV
jgi:septal ring-binding cell division protein DamX